MKKFVVAVAIVVLLLCAQISQAADLQEGWYVKLGIVQLYCVVPTPPHEVWVTWIPSVQPGAFGPFQVAVDTAQNAPYPVTISVPTTQIGVAAGTEVLILGHLEHQINWSASNLYVLYVPYETNYDASQMRLGLYVANNDGRTELAYSETRSGLISTFGSAYLSPGDTFEFRITAVPEPQSFLALFVSTISIISFGWRRGK